MDAISGNLSTTAMMATDSFVRRALSISPPTSLSEILKAGVIGSLGLLIFVVIYRLNFHPLARYPGPFMDKISIWPHIFQCHQGNRHLKIYEAHQKYGHVVRTGPNWLDFDTVTAQQAIHRDRNTNVRKGEWYKTEPAFSGDFSVQTVINKKQHDFRRRVLAPAFSTTALRRHECYIGNNVNIFLRIVAGEGAQKSADGWSKPIDFSEWITYYGFDFISDLSFGSSFNLLEDDTHRYLPDFVKFTSKFLYVAGYLPCNNVVRWLLSTGLLQYLDSGAADGHKFFETSERKMQERRKLEIEIGDANSKRKDIFHYLFNSKDPDTGIGFTHQQLVADSGLFLAAGSDGVAVTLSGAMFYLLKNRETLSRLTAEVREAFAAPESIKTPALDYLPYLNGVVHEALRMAPSVPSAFPRDVEPGGLDVDGLHIPAGVTVGVSAYAVHHNEEYFPDSFSWKPERWIESENTNVSLRRRALCTFSAGRFDCVGKNVALLACKLLLAKLVWLYDVRVPSQELVTGGGSKAAEDGRQREDEYQLTDWLVSYRTGPKVQFRARKS